MLQPLYLENELVQIHPFRPEELHRYEQLVMEIYLILSDEKTLLYIPEKRLRSIIDAENWLKSTILNFHCGRNFLHFITEKLSGKLLGMVDIVSPQIAKKHYRLKSYPYFIEFYLNRHVCGRHLMTDLLPQIVVQLQQRDIENLGAVVNRNNHAARKVLVRSGFQLQYPFDVHQDFYNLSLFDQKMPIRQVG